MPTVPRMPRHERRELLRMGRRCRDWATALRFQAVAKLGEGLTKTAVARALDLAVSTVVKAACRFATTGAAGLFDQRSGNGCRKLDEKFYTAVVEILQHCPQEFGWRRPTWTRELLAKELERRGFVRVAVCTIGRVLRSLGARLGSPRPRVACPWPAPQRERALRKIRRLEAQANRSEPVYYCDEVDIHLNPRIGRDWMLPAMQRVVITPGNNEKYYYAGALDAQTRELVWNGGRRKNSSLFCALLQALARCNPGARAIHLVLDNFSIHTSRFTQAALQAYGGLFRLHFLPPYCPDANRIEREWQELHAMVTRNHRCANMAELLERVEEHLARRSRLARHVHLFGKSTDSKMFANYDR
jgi:transposase